MDKVTIFGAGHVGATTAFYLALQASLDIRLVDIRAGRAEGLALDIAQSLPYTGSGARLSGGGDPELAEGSDLVVVTAGFPRQPGMSRVDLTARNAPIITGIARDVARLAPGAVILVVTNPVDEMTFLSLDASGFPPRRVIGMAGVLDTSRFLYFLERLGEKNPRDANALVLGSHGDDMVPLVDSSTVEGRPLSGEVTSGRLEEIVRRTRDGGAEIVGFLEAGSAYFAPAVSIGAMALAVLGDTGRILPASVYLDGEYGIKGVFLGVPARLGRSGVIEVVEMPLSDPERDALARAAEGIRARTEVLGGCRG